MVQSGKVRKSGKRRYGRGLAVLTLLAMGIVVIVLGLLRGRAPLLLTVSIRVVPAGRFEKTERFFEEPGFSWVSNDSYVYYSNTLNAVCRYHVASGINTPIRVPLGARSWAAGLQASPDGTWLFWAKNTTGGTYHDLIVCEPLLTDLNTMHTMRSFDFDRGQWEQEGRYFLGQDPDWDHTGKRKVVLFDPATGRTRQTLPVAADVDFNIGAATVVMPGHLLEIVPADHPDAENTPNEPITICECGLDKTLHLTRKWTVAPPHNTKTQEVVLSPTGNRIAWLVEDAYVAPALAALHRLLSFIPAHPETRQELWISRLDGTGMRIVGQIPLQLKKGQPLSMSDLLWLPDGKHLSFVYADALWTVPAPR